MNIILQQAGTSDAPLIADMAQRIWREHYPSIIGLQQVDYMLDLFYRPEALEAQMKEGQVFWLAKDGNEVLGYLGVSQKEPCKYFLHKFYIDNDRRGQGLGKVILERLMAKYPDMRELRLTVNRQNYKSINFYFRVGFTIECCVDIPIGDGHEMNDFQMLLKLYLPEEQG